MEQENAYLVALQSANSLSINAQGRLVIGYGPGSATQRQLIYTVGEVPFTGTQWVLVSYGDPTTPQKVLPGSVITALFTTEGSVSGSAGCNQYVAGYTSNQDQITISALLCHCAWYAHRGWSKNKPT